MWLGVPALLAALGWLAGPAPAHGLQARPASSAKYNITIGYLTSIKGDARDRQGLTISGALTLALKEIEKQQILPEMQILVEWNDTRSDTVIATRVITDMSCAGVVAFFGPEDRCQTAAVVAQARNLPMITYKCSEYRSSMMSNLVRLGPPDTQVAKSVISLLRYYRWNKFSVLYEEPWMTVALALENHAKRNNMTINHSRQVIDAYKCCEQKLPCCAPGSWYQLIQDTKKRTRIYVFLGSTTGLVEMMSAMELSKLFEHGEYMVIFVDMMTYSSDRDALKYLIKTEDRGSRIVCPNSTDFHKRARSLLVVVSSEPTETDIYKNFTEQVKMYNTREPFNFQVPKAFASSQFISIYAAYLYDSVILYAKTLRSLIDEDREGKPLTEDMLNNIVTNGSRIVQTMIKNSPYKSITGMSIRLDDRADSEGDVSVLSFKEHDFKDENINCSYSMVPVGHFQQTTRDFPEYKLNPVIADC